MERDNVPRWDGGRGRYEVWYLTLSRPDGEAGMWIRHTLRAPVAGPPEYRLWFARFDREDPGRTFGIHGEPPGAVRGSAHGRRADPRATPDLTWGDARLDPGRSCGSLAGEGREVSWDLRWDTGGDTYRMLPGLLYRGGLAPTKPWTPNPDLTFSGTATVDGEVVPVDGWRGQQGHSYGTRHAERWTWAFCNALDPEGSVFQALAAQGRRGPFLTPVLTFAGLRVSEGWLRFRGSGRAWDVGHWDLHLRSKGYRLEARVQAPPDRLLRARYLDPDDTPRWCHNTEIADSYLRLFERRAGRWAEVAELTSRGTTHAEWAGRTPAPGTWIEHLEVA